MSVAWGSLTTLQDDSPFVIEAMREQARILGFDPNHVTFRCFDVRSQSAILQRANRLKDEYHQQTTEKGTSL